MNIENIISIELKKLAQYWKNNIFKYDFGNNLLKFDLFLISNQFLETENLYKIIKDVTSKENKKVYMVFDKNIIGTKIIKLNIDEK